MQVTSSSSSCLVIMMMALGKYVKQCFIKFPSYLYSTNGEETTETLEPSGLNSQCWTSIVSPRGGSIATPFYMVGPVQCRPGMEF